MITRQRLSASGSAKVNEPALDQLAIPKRAILLFEEQEASHSIHASVEARGVKAHERNERVRLRERACGIFHQHERQSKRFVAELATDQAIGLGGAVAFVEEQVQHVKDAVHTLWIDALNLRVLAEPRARTLQSLVNGVFALKKSQRDLLGAEPAECFQREDELRLGRDRGIGANEEQPKHVVLDLLLRKVDMYFYFGDVA